MATGIDTLEAEWNAEIGRWDARVKKAAEVRKQVSANINQHKNRLLDELRTLEKTPGCAAAARQLESIIGRLENWQAKHAN